MNGRNMQCGGALSLRLSVTDRCQLRCRYCMPVAGMSPHKRADWLSYEEIAQLALWLKEAFGLTKIHLTGGEPPLRPDLHRLIALLAGLGVSDLALTTNRLLLAEQADRLRAAGLRRVNVSLDGLNPNVFRRLTRGGRVEEVLEGLRKARAAGLRPIKLNTVLVRGWNDGEIERLMEFALINGCELRFIELMPIGPGAGSFATAHIPAAEGRERLCRRFSLEPIGRLPGTSSVRYRVSDEAGRKGIVGFIAPCSEPFCEDCRRIRVTADGRRSRVAGRDPRYGRTGGCAPARKRTRRAYLRTPHRAR